jgi:tRNA (guanine-N7-)-methyltransferase
MPINFSKYPLPQRIRHHTKPNLYIPYHTLKNVNEEYPPIINVIEWKNIFNNSNQPDVIDIGCGKGSLLLNYALIHPELNVLGIEIREVFVGWLNNIIKSESLANCYVLWYSVANGLPFISNNSQQKIFYLFPDPWPKRKHIKRRALNIDLLDEIARIIAKDGTFFIATDMPEIDAYHRKLLDSSCKFTYHYIFDDEEWGLPITNKERFCKERGIEYWRMKCRLK